MNRDFLSNFERPSKPKSTPVEPEQEEANMDENEFSDNDYVRNVCFVWPDGRRKFMNYGRLDSGEISPEKDNIRLFFGSEVIELIGLNLENLFTSFALHKRKYVFCDDARYNDLNEDDNATIINEINELTI